MTLAFLSCILHSGDMAYPMVFTTTLVFFIMAENGRIYQTVDTVGTVVDSAD